MYEIKIESPPQLSSEQEQITDLHSLLNVLNVIVGELSLIAATVPEAKPSLLPTQAKLDQLGQIFLSGNAQRQAMMELDGLCEPILSMVQSLEAGSVGQDREELLLSRTNLLSVFRVLKQRVIELDQEGRGTEQWTRLPIDLFSERIVEVFRAIEKNARGRYGICFNLARCDTRDYYVDLKVESELGSEIYMPHRMQDVVRDLAANARKYTEPGGRVMIAIYQCRTALHCCIEDTGYGIPQDEMPRVVEFGYRASNVAHIKSYGGGLGLTKAAWFVHRWKGTLRIASKEGEGTRIRLSVPNSAQMRVAG